MQLCIGLEELERDLEGIKPGAHLAVTPERAGKLFKTEQDVVAWAQERGRTAEFDGLGRFLWVFTNPERPELPKDPSDTTAAPPDGKVVQPVAQPVWFYAASVSFRWDAVIALRAGEARRVEPGQSIQAYLPPEVCVDQAGWFELSQGEYEEVLAGLKAQR